MAARDKDVPRYSYVLAVCAGLIGQPSAYALLDYYSAWRLGEFMERLASWGYGELPSVPVALVFFALAHAAAGGLFGLMWPEKTWRWGVWLFALPACVLSFIEPGVRPFLVWVLVTILPACLCAYAAGTAHLKFVAVDESR